MSHHEPGEWICPLDSIGSFDDSTAEPEEDADLHNVLAVRVSESDVARGCGYHHTQSD